MIVATINGDRARATQGARGASCPSCGAPVIAKCGSVVTWHWAHEAHAECPWAGETEWHREWKSDVADAHPAATVEFIDGDHRADVLLDGLAFEFQSKGLDGDDVLAREEHWGRVVWVVNTLKAKITYKATPGVGEDTFVWPHAWRSWKAATQPLVLDRGSKVIVVYALDWRTSPVKGRGLVVSREEFIADPQRFYNFGVYNSARIRAERAEREAALAERRAKEKRDREERIAAMCERDRRAYEERVAEAQRRHDEREALRAEVAEFESRGFFVEWPREGEFQVAMPKVVTIAETYRPWPYEDAFESWARWQHSLRFRDCVESGHHVCAKCDQRPAVLGGLWCHACRIAKREGFARDEEVVSL